jgi:CubicO group peptidase (beta-lactamase class C family)
MTMELDGSGTMVGSTYFSASARDWARFGLLYLNDGVVGGKRILPEGWVEFSTRPTLGFYYGAGFWTLRSDHPWSRHWATIGIPSDAFFASGNLGQRIVILPSQRMVIVRLGDAVEPDGDIEGLGRLVKEVVAATNPQ